MEPIHFDRQLAEAALEMARRPSVPTTVDRAVQLALDVIVTCDAAAVSLFEDNKATTVAASEEAIREVVEQQFRIGAGPSISAYTSREPVYSPALVDDPRWPEYGALMSQHVGLNCAYAVPLAIRDKPVGVLSVFGKKPDAFDEDDRSTAQVIAAHAAVAVAESVGQEQLEAALNSRTVIGQATGVVMERWGLDAAAAFSVLRRLSQTHNVKIRDIAARIVETGQLP
jgi:GAF domain-containing protein